jgi:hypothetical protein
MLLHSEDACGPRRARPQSTRAPLKGYAVRHKSSSCPVSSVEAANDKLLRSIPLAVMLILAPIGRLVRSNNTSDADANRIKTEIVRRVKN